MDGTQFDTLRVLGKASEDTKLEKKQAAHCPDINLFAGYLDNNLVETERDNVENHMAECGVCRDNMYEIRMLMDAPQVDVPQSLADNVKKHLSATSEISSAGKKLKI